MESSETSTQSPDHQKKINRTTLAYIAGLMDGEGCVSATTRYQKKYIALRVSITNTCLPVLQHVQSIFGGRIHPKDTGLGTRPCYRWEVNQSDTAWFLKLLIPFMRIKQRQARLAVVLRSMVERGVAQHRRHRIVEMIFAENHG